MDANENDLAMEENLLNGDGEDDLDGDPYDGDEQMIDALLNDQEDQEEEEEEGEEEEREQEEKFQQERESASRTSNSKLDRDAGQDHRGHESEDDILDLEDIGGHLELDDEDEGFTRRSEKFAVERARGENTEDYSGDDRESIASHKTAANDTKAPANAAKPSPVPQNKPQGAYQNRPQTAPQTRPRSQNATPNKPLGPLHKNMQGPNRKGMLGKKPQGWFQPPNSTRKFPYDRRNNNMLPPNRGGFLPNNQMAPSPTWDNRSGPGVQPNWNSNSLLASNPVELNNLLNLIGFSTNFRSSFEAPSQASEVLNFEPPPPEPQRQVESFVPPTGGSAMQPRPVFSSFDVPASMDTEHVFNKNNYNNNSNNNNYSPPGTLPPPRPTYHDGYYPGNDQKEEQPLYPPHITQDFSVPPPGLPPGLPPRSHIGRGREPNFSHFSEPVNNRQFGNKQVRQNQNLTNNGRPQVRRPPPQLQQQRRPPSQLLKQRRPDQQQQHQQQQQQQQRELSPLTVNSENFQGNTGDVDYRIINNVKTPPADVDMRISQPKFHEASPKAAEYTIDKRGYKAEGFASPQGGTRRAPVVVKTIGIDEEATTKLYLQKIEQQKIERQKLLEKKEERRKLRMLQEAKLLQETSLQHKTLPQNLIVPVQSAPPQNVFRQGDSPWNQAAQESSPVSPWNQPSQKASPVSPRNQLAQKVSPVSPRNQFPQKASPVGPVRQDVFFQDEEEDENPANFHINVANDDFSVARQSAVAPVLPKTAPEAPKPTGFMANRVVSVKNKNYNISSINSNLKVINTETAAPSFPEEMAPTTDRSFGANVGGGAAEKANSRENSSGFFSGRKIVTKSTRHMSSRLVVIDNLSSGTTQQKIVQLCEGVGQVTKIAMFHGEARIIFETKEAAYSFVQKYNRRMVDLSMIQARLEPYI